MQDMKIVKGVYRVKDQRRLYAEITLRDPDLGLLWLIGCTTGFRVSDLLNLRAGWFTEKRVLDVRETKTGKIRQVAIPKTIWRAIRGKIRLSGIKPEEQIFAGVTRQRAHKLFKTAGEAIGLNQIGTHSMRKTYAWNKLIQTRSFEAVQTDLNHKYMSTTFSYLADGLLSILPGRRLQNSME
jgi:integrase